MFHKFASLSSRSIVVPVAVGTTVGLGTVYYLWLKDREAAAAAKKVKESVSYFNNTEIQGSPSFRRSRIW